MIMLYIILGSIMWFFCVDATWDLIYDGMAAIPKEDKKLTKYPLVRGLMLLGSIVTLVALLVLVVLKPIYRLVVKAKQKRQPTLI